MCSHCDGLGHTVDKCYKLHGYPPSHPKYKSKPIQSKAHANQAQGSAIESTARTWEPPLPHAQCKHVIALLSSQLQNDSVSAVVSQHSEHVVSCFNGIYSLSITSSLIPDNSWILDTGATHHICCSLSLFSDIQSVLFHSYIA